MSSLVCIRITDAIGAIDRLIIAQTVSRTINVGVIEGLPKLELDVGDGNTYILTRDSSWWLTFDECSPLVFHISHNGSNQHDYVTALTTWLAYLFDAELVTRIK
jgi:hypothetical protein